MGCLLEIWIQVAGIYAAVASYAAIFAGWLREFHWLDRTRLIADVFVDAFNLWCIYEGALYTHRFVAVEIEHITTTDELVGSRSVEDGLGVDGRSYLEGNTAREYELALQWLLDAGLIYKVYNVKAPRLPLASYEDRAAFKIFVLDVGLLGAMSNLKATTIVDGNSIFTEFKGALTEQYVLQQLILRYEPYYYAKTNSTQEIDFLLQDEEDEIVPLEVKAETNVKAKSLRQFVADNQSKKAYRISMNDYQQEDWVTNVPLYAVNGLEF